ncbi:MAG: DUF2062 domain-containing protein [Gammaproteobacteria bacterium]|nr:DUF2062 domain-containing protein [Gammaproteobacteria bacterium]MDH3751036.1 DUF2062 domain-containing protein [Gammaproteobacteria bacterium]
MSPFQHLLHDQRLWGIRRKTIVPAFSLGLFIAFLPVPIHFVLAALAALALRINIPVATLTTFVVNPLTVGPLFYSAYRLGAFLLSIEPGPFSVELSIDWVTTVFTSIWQPLLLGCLLIGSTAALIGYVTLDALWRYSVHDYKTKKRNQRS